MIFKWPSIECPYRKELNGKSYLEAKVFAVSAKKAAFKFIILMVIRPTTICRTSACCASSIMLRHRASVQ